MSYGKDWHRVKLLVLARDSYLCQVCGAPVNTPPHHIVSFAVCRCHSPGNLISLCVLHHKEAHGGQLSKDQLFAILKRRFGADYVEVSDS